MSFTYSGGGVMPQPTLAWAFDGTTTPYIGTVSSTTVNGTVAYGSGKYNQALNIQNPSGTFSNGINYSLTTTPFSVDTGFSECFWFRCNDLSYLVSAQQILVFYVGSNNNQFRFGITTGGRIQFEISDSVGTKTLNLIFPTVGEWYHLAAVSLNGIVTIYVNGAYYSQIAYVPSAVALNNFWIGRGPNGSGLTNGDYDDLRIFDRALTSTQVQSIYNQQGVPGMGVQVATHLLSLIPSSPVFMQTFGTSAVPTSDLYGATLTSTGSPTMYLDATRGYVFPATGTTYMTSNFNLPVSYSKTIWVYLTGAPQLGNLLSSAVGSGAIHYLFFENSYSLRAGHRASGSVVNYVTDPGTISLNQWTHYVLTYDQTTTTMKLYKNAIQVASTTNAAMSWTGGNAVAMCQYGGGNTLTNGQVDNPIIYNRELTAAEVSLLYTSQLSKPTLGETTAGLTYNPISLTGTPLFSQLSQAARTSAVGAFSLRAVNGTSAKAVNVRNGTTSATQDFYADRLGNLLTAPVTGLPLVDWLGGATGYVTTWYDQSGAGNHATQGTAANQPTLNISNVSISFNGSQWFSNATPTGMFIPLYQNTYSVVTKHQQWSAGGAWGTGNTASFANGSFNGLRWSTGSNYQNFIGGGFLTFGPQPGTYPVVATVVNNRTNVIGYINGTQSASSTQNPTIEPIYSQFIGQAPNGGVMQGELRAVLFFQSAISTVDRTIVEGIVLNVTSGTSTATLSPGTYTFTLAGGVGGTGGNGTKAGGSGMILSAVFTLSASTSIKYVVGGSGGNFIGSGGGGGGSYVYDLTNSRALFVAGGGGGAGVGSVGNNATGSASPGTGAGGAVSYASGGGGGGGLFGNGTDAGAGGGKSFLVSASPVGSGTSAGGTSAFPAADGGFGGGGAGGAGNSGGGGGGYTGGNQLGASIGSNGGTSYAIAGSSGLTESITNTSSGYITVSN